MNSPLPPEAKQQPSSSAVPVRGLTLVLTQLTKLAGLAVAFNEAFIRTDSRVDVIALAAFMMAGAQVSETVLLTLIDRFLGPVK